MRLVLQRKTDLALRALRKLQSTETTLNAKVLAKNLASTPHFLPQVMRPLVHAGWVQSGTGPLGGYRLVVDLSNHSILELIELIEGPVDDGQCVLQGGPCSGTTECAVHEAWSEARLALSESLGLMPISIESERGTT